jgi:acetyl esterase/lipase
MPKAAGGPVAVGQRLRPEYECLLESQLFADIDVENLSNYRIGLPGLGTTERVERIDLVIDGEEPLQIRVHQPHASRGSAPVALTIHGGGFIVGDYNMDDAIFEDWCPNFGMVGVSVNYRLAPETPFPGALNDCLAAWHWIHANADAFGLDRGRVGVVGASAGAGLAAALAQCVRDDGGVGLAFQLLESPMLDDRQATPSSQMDGLAVWPREANEFGWSCYLGSSFVRDAPPPYAVPARTEDLSDLPPTFISVGGADGFRDEDVDYALRLTRAGVPTELHVYPGAPHGYQLMPESAVAIQSRRDADDWLERMIRFSR